MLTTILILLGAAALIAALPWIVEAIFGRRRGVLFGALETIAIVGFVPYWFYLWNVECVNAPPPVIIGDMAYDNDATCRVLLFGAPVLLVFVAIALFLLIPSTITLLVEARKRAKGA